MVSDKLLIHLMIPAALQEFDVFIPQDLLMSEVSKLLTSAVVSITSGEYDSDQNALLCSKDRQEVLPPCLTARQYGLRHGECLLLL